MEPKSKTAYFQINHLFRRFILHSEKFYDSNCRNYTAGKEARQDIEELCRVKSEWRKLTLEENSKPPRVRRKNDAKKDA